MAEQAPCREIRVGFHLVNAAGLGKLCARVRPSACGALLAARVSDLNSEETDFAPRPRMPGKTVS